MFSGIIEAKVKALGAEQEAPDLLRIQLQRPEGFTDIRTGDSIAVNGVCLTIESFTEQLMQFAIAAESLKVTGWTAEYFLSRSHNLERSLRFGDRIHGHMVSGHVEAMAKVVVSEAMGEGSWLLSVELPESLLPFVWPKASVCLHGTSLTVNELQKSVASVCLIPETVQRTNLVENQPGDSLCVEPDYMAKALYHWRNFDRAQHS